MGRRRSQRVPFESSARVFGIDAEGRPFTRLGSTADVSATGARVSGIHVPLRIGDIVGVQSGAEKARYSVVWIGSPGTARAGQLGLRCTEPGKWIWKVPLPQAVEDLYEPKAAREERRQHPRLACDIGVEVKTTPDAPGSYARCTDVSKGGFYLETWSPQPVGTILTFAAKLPDGELRGVATVRSMHPAFGMGLKFLRMEDPEVLDKLIERFSTGIGPRVASSGVQPFGNRESQIVADTSSSERGGSTESNHTPPRQLSSTEQRRVLVAEDSRFLRNAYGHFLARAGFEVMLAEDGEAMLRMATTQLPDVIVTDLLMPKMGGVDALKLLKEDPATSDIPVIVISALSQNNERKIVSAGAHCYVEKMRASPELLPGIVKKAMNVIKSRSPQKQESSLAILASDAS